MYEWALAREASNSPQNLVAMDLTTPTSSAIVLCAPPWLRGRTRFLESIESSVKWERTPPPGSQVLGSRFWVLPHELPLLRPPRLPRHRLPPRRRHRRRPPPPRVHGLH